MTVARLIFYTHAHARAHAHTHTHTHTHTHLRFHQVSINYVFLKDLNVELSSRKRI